MRSAPCNPTLSLPTTTREDGILTVDHKLTELWTSLTLHTVNINYGCNVPNKYGTSIYSLRTETVCHFESNFKIIIFYVLCNTIVSLHVNCVSRDTYLINNLISIIFKEKRRIISLRI